MCRVRMHMYTEASVCEFSPLTMKRELHVPPKYIDPSHVCHVFVQHFIQVPNLGARGGISGNPACVF